MHRPPFRSCALYEKVTNVTCCLSWENVGKTKRGARGLHYACAVGRALCYDGGIVAARGAGRVLGCAYRETS